MGTRDAYQRVLVQACVVAGDEVSLAKALGVSVSEVVGWLLGEGQCPNYVFLAAVDLCLDGTRRKLDETSRQLHEAHEQVRTTRALLDEIKRRHSR